MQINWAELPFVRSLIPFVLGILLGSYIPSLPLWSIPLLTLLYAALHTRPRRIFPLLPLLLMFFGIELAQVDQPPTPSNLSLIVKVEEAPTYWGKTTRFKASHLQLQFKLMVYLKSDSLLEVDYGDVLVLKNRLDTPAAPLNPGAFDLRSYFKSRGIHYISFLGPGEWKKLPGSRAHPIKRFALKCRAHFLGVLEQHLHQPQIVGVAAALLLGDRSDISPELKSAYASTGTIHILAVSGLHVGILFVLLNSVLGWMDKFPGGSKLKLLSILLGIWFFCLLSGASPSVLRASLMCSLLTLGMAFSRPINPYNSLAATAFCLLLLDPLLISSVGFQLSFLAVLGIMGLPIYEMWSIRNWLGDRVWAITSLSIAAQVATLPLSLFYFGQFPLSFLISNLVAIPAAAAILYTGVLLFCVSSLLGLASWVGWALNVLIQGLNQTVEMIAGLPYASIKHIYLDGWSCFLLSLLILFLSLGTIHRNIRFIGAGLLAAILLVSIQVKQIWDAEHQHRLVVYSVPPYSAIELLSGRFSKIYADSALLKDTDKIFYQIQPFRVKSRIGETRAEPMPEYLLLGGKRIKFLSGRISGPPPPKNLDLDYLILKGKPWLSLEKLPLYYDYDILILDASSPEWLRSKWRATCDSLGIEYWDVGRDGAFVESW